MGDLWMNDAWLGDLWTGDVWMSNVWICDVNVFILDNVDKFCFDSIKLYNNMWT